MTIFFAVLSILIALVGSVCASFGYSSLTNAVGKKTMLWGNKFSEIPGVEKVRFAGISGWILLSLGAIIFGVIWGITVGSWDDFPMILVVLMGLAIFMPIVVCVHLGDKWIDKTVQENNNALFLSNLPIFQDVEAQINLAKTVAVFENAIALYDEKDYCFFCAQYSAYALGDLTDGEQVKLIGYYFRQKYGTQFNYKTNRQTIYVNNKAVADNVKSILFIRKGK